MNTYHWVVLNGAGVLLNEVGGDGDEQRPFRGRNERILSMTVSSAPSGE